MYSICIIAGSLPFAAILAQLIYYCLRRSAWKRKRRRGQRNPGFCPSASALGVALLFTQIFIRPSLKHAIEERQQENADQDDSGDPEHPDKFLHRQLKRIRRGEQLDDLVSRM
jgi:hypothetical protein